MDASHVGVFLQISWKASRGDAITHRTLKALSWSAVPTGRSPFPGVEASWPALCRQSTGLGKAERLLNATGGGHADRRTEAFGFRLATNRFGDRDEVAGSGKRARDPGTHDV
jgi:hypothetical protein